MKLSKWAFALAIAAAFWPGAALFAQVGSGVSPKYRSATPSAAHRYGDYYTSQDSQPVAPVEPPAAEAPAEEEEEKAPEPWRIAPNNNCYGITLKNWLAQSFTWNPQNPVDRFNGPVTWTDRSNDYQLNEAYFSLERVTNTENAVYDLGFRMDALWGTSSRFDTASGLEDNFNKDHSFYGLALPNMYLEGAYEDFKLKAGHFTSPVGFFAVGTANNFFNTLPYTFQYGEPFTHTGLLGTKKFSDELSIGAGIIEGWDAFGTSFNSHAGYLGTLNYTRKEQGDSIAFVQIFSDEPNFTPVAAGTRPDFSPRYLQTFVYTRPLKQINENLTYVLHSDFGWQSRALANGDDATWYGANQYLFWKQNDCWSWGANFEWFRDDGGFRVGGFLPNFATLPTRTRGLPAARSGYDGSFYQMTLGPKWTPDANWIIRPNLRWDFFDGSSPAGLRPYDDGNKNWQVIVALDAVVLF